MSEQLVNYIAEMQEEEALALTKQLLDGGTPPTQILDDCRAAKASPPKMPCMTMTR